VRWSDDEGLRFYRIDDGESLPMQSQSPLAVPQAELADAERESAALRFEWLAQQIEPRVYRFVFSRIWLGRPRCVPELQDC
jgi:hypothetical protein